MIDPLVRDIFAVVGAAWLVWNFWRVIRENDHPSSREIRRRPWTPDERDQQQRWRRIQGR